MYKKQCYGDTLNKSKQRTNLTIRIELTLTQKLGQPRWLIIVFHGDTNRIEEHKNDHEPVKPLLFYSVADFKPKKERFTIITAVC